MLEYEPECEALNLIFHEEECVSLDIDSSDDSDGRGGGRERRG